MTDIRPKRTWSDVHEDFYREPPANPGKILLLYSPDSRSFKELQVAFRSFLEMACHCVVLDLFDEELLQAIGKYLLKKETKFKNVGLVHSDRSGSTKKN